MRQVVVLIFVCVFIFSQKTLACECDSQGVFLKVGLKSAFIALVKVVEYSTFKDAQGKKMPMSMKVEVVDIYKGKEKRKIVAIWGDNGNLCRPYLLEFDKGKYYVIAFGKSSDKHGHKEEKLADYFISSCGEYWLRADVKKRTASGVKPGEYTRIKLADLKSQLQIK